MNDTIEIPADLRGCHKLITLTKKALVESRAKPVDPYALRKPVTGILDVEVSAKAQTRALRLLQAIILQSEKNSWAVEGNSEKEGSRIRIGDDPVTFSMFEKTERIESSDGEKAKWSWRPEYRDTGLLALEIADYLPDGMRRTWADGKKQRLENILGEFLEGVNEASAAIRVRRLEREEWHRQYEEEVRQREERERRIKLEKRRRGLLLAQAKGCETATLIRRMITDVQQAISKSPTRWPSEDTSEWTTWAGGIADRLDPFLNGYFPRAFKWTELDAELELDLED